jgi:hypothetical protein
MLSANICVVVPEFFVLENKISSGCKYLSSHGRVFQAREQNSF